RVVIVRPHLEICRDRRAGTSDGQLRPADTLIVRSVDAETAGRRRSREGGFGGGGGHAARERDEDPFRGAGRRRVEDDVVDRSGTEIEGRTGPRYPRELRELAAGGTADQAPRAVIRIAANRVLAGANVN